VYQRKVSLQTGKVLEHSGEFDSLIYLFESVGYLISINEIGPQKQSELLVLVQTPLLSRIQAIVEYGENTQINEVLVWELSDLITAVGSISKGFPDTPKSNAGQEESPPWSDSWKLTLQGVLVVLGKYNQHRPIREASRFALQRMVGCMGVEFLDFVMTFFSSGLLSTDSAGELTDFLPFIGLLIHKFGSAISSMLIELWIPLRNKLSIFLNQPPIGSDDILSIGLLKRADLTLLTTLFTSDLDCVLASPKNLPSLPALLDQILGFVVAPSDLAEQKLVFAVLSKMVHCWASTLSTEAPSIVGSKQDKPPLPKHPLQGFDAFIYDRIVPLTFLPLSEDFPLSDSPAHSILIEIAILHQTALKSLGQQYVNYLTGTYLPSISCPPALIGDFGLAMLKDKQEFRVYLLVIDFLTSEILPSCQRI
jgi:exportin-T